MLFVFAGHISHGYAVPDFPQAPLLVNIPPTTPPPPPTYQPSTLPPAMAPPPPGSALGMVPLMPTGSAPTPPIRQVNGGPGPYAAAEVGTLPNIQVL